MVQSSRLEFQRNVEVGTRPQKRDEAIREVSVEGERLEPVIDEEERCPIPGMSIDGMV